MNLIRSGLAEVLRRQPDGKSHGDTFKGLSVACVAQVTQGRVKDSPKESVWHCLPLPGMKTSSDAIHLPFSWVLRATPDAT